MIACSITARNFEVDGKMREYIEQKLGSLEKYVPRRSRGDNLVCSVVLEDDPSGREDNRYVCEVVMSLRGSKLVSREGTVNMYAAVDIVEAKLKAQLVKYKEKRTFGLRRGRMLAQWLGRRQAPVLETGAVEPDGTEQEAA